MTDVDIQNAQLFHLFLSICLISGYLFLLYFFHRELNRFDRSLSMAENQVNENVTNLGYLYNEISLNP